MNAERLHEVLRGLPVGPVRYFSSLASTNDEAARWASEGAPHLALVVADEQTAGKGRSGRRWLTPPGSALAFSLVLRPRLLPEDEKQIAFATRKGRGGPGTGGEGFHFPAWALSRLTALGSLGVSSALELQFGLSPQIKWPNDVLLGGKKVAGILVESQWESEHLGDAILGIGINVAKDSIVSGQAYRFPPTSIESFLGTPVDRWRLLAAVLQSLLDWMPKLASAGFLDSWQDRLAYRGETVRIMQDANAPLEGRLAGLDEQGALILITRDGRRLALQSGEVQLRPIEG